MENELDNDFIKAHINDFILSTLISGEKYGYEIANAIKQRTNNQFELKQPTMYAALQRLEKNGFIKSNWQDSDIGGKRHYYCLAEKGVNELNKNRKIWTKSLDVVSDFFGTPFFQSEKMQKVNNEINEDISEVKNSVGIAAYSPVINNVAKEKTNEPQLTEIKQENLNKSFLDDFNEEKLDYNQNLEMFTDAMNRLRNNESQKSETANEDVMVNFLTNADQNSELINEALNEPTLFEFAERKEKDVVEEKKADPSDSQFLLDEERLAARVAESTEKVIFKTERVDNHQKQTVNDAVFISQLPAYSPAFSSLDPSDVEKRIIENTFTSDDFNLQINYVSSPIKFDDVAKKAIYDEKQFKRNVLDKRYSISNSTKWNNIKVASKFYNANKLNFMALLLTIPYFILAFIGTFLIAHFTDTMSNVFANSLYICLALFACAAIYFGFRLYVCPNKKAEYKKDNLPLVYAAVIAIILVLVVLAIYSFGSSSSLWLNTNTFMWLNLCVFAIGIFVYSLARYTLIKYAKRK